MNSELVVHVYVNIHTYRTVDYIIKYNSHQLSRTLHGLTMISKVLGLTDLNTKVEDPEVLRKWFNVGYKYTHDTPLHIEIPSYVFDWLLSFDHLLNN